MHRESQGIVDQIRLLQEYWPLVTLGQQIVAEKDPYRRAIVIADAAEWLASKSGTKLDDEAIALLIEIVKTPQGEQFVRWLLRKAEGLT